VAFVPSAALLVVVGSLYLWAGGDMKATALPPDESFWGAMLGVGLVAPVVETLILAALVSLLRRAIRQPALIAAVSAIIFGSLHALVEVLWFFGTVWSFFVFTCAYLAWRSDSFRSAFIAACVPHILINVSVTSLGPVLDAA
jgi:hypothetical protein